MSGMCRPLAALGVRVVAARRVLPVHLALPRAVLQLAERPLPAVVLEALLEAPPLLLRGLPAARTRVLQREAQLSSAPPAPAMHGGRGRQVRAVAPAPCGERGAGPSFWRTRQTQRPPRAGLRPGSLCSFGGEGRAPGQLLPLRPRGCHCPGTALAWPSLCPLLCAREGLSFRFPTLHPKSCGQRRSAPLSLASLVGEESSPQHRATPGQPYTGGQ